MRVEVRIGRNVGDQPMSLGRWSSFIESTAKLLHPAVAVTAGSGSWDGVQEENCTIVGHTNQAKEVLVGLAAVARWYEQDVIAVHTEGAHHWILVGADDSLRLGEPST